MNQKKLFLGISAAILSLAGVFAVKTHARFTYVTRLYAGNGITCTEVAWGLPGGGPFVTASWASGSTVARINTGQYDLKYYLYATSACSGSSKVYFQP